MPEPNRFNQFHRLIKHGDLAGVRHLIEAGADVNTGNERGWTILMLAALQGHSPIVTYLLTMGADIAATNTFGESALALAAIQGECNSLQILLESGAPIDISPHGKSLLEYVGFGKGVTRTQRHVELLREAGAK